MTAFGGRHSSTGIKFNIMQIAEVLDASFAVALLTGVVGFALGGVSWLVIGAVLGGLISSIFFGAKRDAYGR